VRSGNWKLITFADGDQHLFNLADDPSESNDLANQKPELVKQLQARIDQWNDSL
jgi:hypothetical protein